MTTSPHNQSLEDLSETVEKLTVRLSSLKPSAFEQIEQWRKAAYEIIDKYCEKKRHELIEVRQSHQETELDHLRKRINESIEKHDNTKDHFDSINHDLQMAEIRINELEHLRLTIHPLLIDEHLIVRRHLFPLPHPHTTIYLKAGSESAVGTNINHLLVDRDGTHLCLLDKNLAVVHETPSPREGINRICWAKSINRFIIITFKEILLLDEKTMQLEKCPISTKIEWWRGTCSEDILYLSTAQWGSSVYEFDMHSSFKPIKQWNTPETCGKEEIICDLKYSEGFLAMPIFNKYRDESRLDLKSATTFECIWSARTQGRCRCCRIDVNQWLVMDNDDRRFFHISADGRILETGKYDQHERLEDIVPWGTDNIIVLTKKKIYLHKLS